MNIILLCGGSGKRLWPLSNDVRSKQFIEAFRTETGGTESMLQRLFRQIRTADSSAKITFATSGSQVSAIRNQVGNDAVISEEPERKDTFPAIILAAQYLCEVQEVPADEPVIICPVDSFVDGAYFDALKEMDSAVRSRPIKLLLMGVSPVYASDQYGYIYPEGSERISKVRKFVEKPEGKKAGELIRAGALWNCGVFAARLSYLLEYAHKLLSFDDYQDLLAKYPDVQAISFDRAVVEREQDLAVLKFEGPWKKLDTWESLSESMGKDNTGNVHLDSSCTDVRVINELDLPVLALGLSDIIISASSEGILVSDRKSSANLRPMVEGLEKRGVMFADKSWGKFQVLDVEAEGLTVKATIHAGHRMSYHSHERRDEVWTIISGEGSVIVDGMEQPVQAGDVITMQAGCRHTVIANTELKLIEVQLGREISVHDKREYELED